MTAGPRYEYYWADGEKIKKPIKCTAPEYVEYLMDWIQTTLDDETIFPARVGMYHYHLELRQGKQATVAMQHAINQSVSQSQYNTSDIHLWCSHIRCAIPKDLRACHQEDHDATVPSLRTHLLQPFLQDCRSWRGSASQHLLQTYEAYLRLYRSICMIVLTNTCILLLLLLLAIVMVVMMMV
jgi:hypothetical protein